MQVESVRRRAFTVTEMIAAFTLLGVVFTLSIQVLRTAGLQRQKSAQVQAALMHATDVLERVTVRDWAELPTGAVARDKWAHLGDSSEFQTDVQIASDDEDGVPARRVTVTVQDRNQPESWKPIVLHAWVFPASTDPEARP